MNLELDKLGSKELKELYLAVKSEQKRRGKRTPERHGPTTWPIPKKAVTRPPDPRT